MMNINQNCESPLSIGLFSPGWPADAFPNGIVTYVKTIAESLKAMGHRVTVLATNVADDYSDPDVYHVGKPPTRPCIARRSLDFLSFRLAPELAKPYLARRTLIDAIRLAVAERNIQILEMEESFGWARWVRRSIPAAVCVRLHGPWFLNGKALGVSEDAQFRKRIDLERRGILSADAVSSPSQDVMDRTRDYYGLPLSKAEVIPNPTPPIPAADRWHPQNADPRKILFIGRFDRHKGGDLAIEGFAHVLREFPDTKLCFVGPDRGFVDDGGRTWNLEEFARDRIPGALGVGSFEWLGHQPHHALQALRRGAALTVIPSRYDNFPGTAQEALASACPIVAASTGGIPEIIRDGVTGRLHRPGDPRDLADKIAETLRNPAAAAEMASQAGADCQRRFDPDLIAAQLVESYRKVLRTGRG